MSEPTRRSPIRLTVVMTHPVQYLSPWFRHLATRREELALTVLYAVEPTPDEQGTGFGQAFRWDQPLTEGYVSKVLRRPSVERRAAAHAAGSPAPGGPVELGSHSFHGVDVPEIGRAIDETRPQVVLVPGWHSITLLRAIRHCRRIGLPLLYRGDSTLESGPAGWRRAFWRLHTRRRLALYDRYLAVGRRARRYLLAHGVAPEAIHASPHCLDAAAFAAAAAPHRSATARSALRRRLGLSENAFVVLFVGKVAPIKRPLALVEAVARLGDGAALLMVGDGELLDACRRRAERLGLAAAFPGFLNQSQLSEVHGAADCIALPSVRESWGFAVHEAMAAGLPAVVSSRVGCAPDLVVPGVTGELFEAPGQGANGDGGAVAELTGALSRLRRRLPSDARTAERETVAGACRRRAAGLSFETAAAGLLAACQRESADRAGRLRPAILMPAGGMVIAGGLELQSFEVMRVARSRGASVHTVFNGWGNRQIVPLAEAIGASWSTARYLVPFTPRLLTVRGALRLLLDVTAISFNLLIDATRLRPDVVFLPDWSEAVRNAPVLLWLKATGSRVLMRVGNVPEEDGRFGRLHRILWRRLLPLLVDRFVANSEFGRLRLAEAGVPEDRLALVRNRPASRTLTPDEDADAVALARRRPSLLCLGQIAPFKGTHLAVEATLALLAEGRDIQLLIVGRRSADDPELASYLAELDRRIAEAGAGERIHFLGHRRNVPAIMSACYLLLAPILQQETFGNVVLEAARAGLPAVAFPHGGLTELVEHDVTGHLCAEPTAEALADAARLYLDRPMIRKAASEAAWQRFADPVGPYGERAYEQAWWRLLAGREAAG